MVKFEKVPYEVYKDAVLKTTHGIEFKDESSVREEYESIKLPKRGTHGSAGYDFFAPYDFYLRDAPNSDFRDDVVIPTGIRLVTDRDDIALICVPRSGQGFKYGVSLLNTVGVIDSDYQFSDNYGHIMCKMQSKYDCNVEKGKGFMQGIIVPFIKTDDDHTTEERNGGFGSTDSK